MKRFFARSRCAARFESARRRRESERPGAALARRQPLVSSSRAGAEKRQHERDRERREKRRKKNRAACRTLLGLEVRAHDEDIDGDGKRCHERRHLRLKRRQPDEAAKEPDESGLNEKLHGRHDGVLCNGAEKAVPRKAHADHDEADGRCGAGNEAERIARDARERPAGEAERSACENAGDNRILDDAQERRR